MSRWIKVNGAYKEILQRYIKVGGVWKPVDKRYTKVTGAWQETWPLQPGPVSGLTLTQLYQNDRQEARSDWTAPTTGAAVVDYRVIYTVSGIGTAEFIVAAGTLTHTYTNGTAGLQGWAGRTITVQVIPRSAGPREGFGTTTAAQTLNVLPPPPMPASISMAMSSYSATTSWGAVTGNRIDNYRLRINWGGADHDYVVSKTSTSFAGQPWDPNTVAGGNVYYYIRAEGQGGVSSWRGDSGALPQTPSLNVTRFYNSQLIQDVNCPGDGCNTYWQNVTTNGPWNFYARAGVGRVTLPGSESWARDDSTYYRFIYIPVTDAKGWSGRAVGSNWALKLPMPYYIAPTYSETWYSERGWFGLPIKQGQSSAGIRTGCFFYSGRILNAFTPNRTGYDFTVGTTNMMFGRTANGGFGAAVAIRLWLHGANDRPASVPGLAGGVDFASVARNNGGLYPLPYDWGNQLKAGWYAGTAIYFPPEGLNASIGNVSNHYIEAYGHNTTSGFGITYGTLVFYHDA
jgi:hypothetical protein